MTITENEIDEFIDYFYSWYGDKHLYDLKKTKQQLQYACMAYILLCKAGVYDWGGGDSIDRERVRDLFLYPVNPLEFKSK
tara:strand:- start:1327 stop:1566 length:240 start_codon:yes stop_codon:yes gene_type:complete